MAKPYKHKWYTDPDLSLEEKLAISDEKSKEEMGWICFLIAIAFTCLFPPLLIFWGAFFGLAFFGCREGKSAGKKAISQNEKILMDRHLSDKSLNKRVDITNWRKA